MAIDTALKHTCKILHPSEGDSFAGATEETWPTEEQIAALSDEPCLIWRLSAKELAYRGQSSSSATYGGLFRPGTDIDERDRIRWNGLTLQVTAPPDNPLLLNKLLTVDFAVVT